MGCPPNPLSLSLDSTLRPFLLSSSTPPSTTSSTTNNVIASVSLKNPRPSPFLKLLRRFCPSSAPKPVAPANATPTSPPRPGSSFLGPGDLCALHVLRDFSVEIDLAPGGGDRGGLLQIRPIEAEDLNATVELLKDSFPISTSLPTGYLSILGILVRQYVEDRMALAPHVAVLVGFYRERGAEGAAQLAGIAEISFDARGANDISPAVTAPKECPYICNMAVKKTLRRRRIGWYLLEACEELITRMKAKRKVYLHCRVIDKIPYRMYTKAGYKVVKTDSVLVWLTLQRRKYLMCKELPPHPDDTTSDVSICDDNLI